MSGRGGRPCCFHHAPAGPQEGRAAAPALAAQLQQLPQPAPVKTRHRIPARPAGGAGASSGSTGQREPEAKPGAGARSPEPEPTRGSCNKNPEPEFFWRDTVADTPAPSSQPFPYRLCWPCVCCRCFKHFEGLQSPGVVMTQVGEVPKQEVHQVGARLRQNWAEGPGGSGAEPSRMS